MTTAARRHLIVAVALSLAAGLAVATPPFETLRGLSIDWLTGLRWHVFGNARAPQESPAVVIALDEETYRTPPFEGTPNVTWLGEIGRVLSAVVEGGATVVGFDIVFPVSIEQSQVAFGGETLGSRVRGFDRDFLRSLNGAAKEGKVVLGQVQFRAAPIRPSPGQRAAVGQQRNIRPLNVYADPDEVVRRLPLSFEVDGERMPGMAVELAARALKAAPQWEAGTLMLAGYRVPAVVPNTITLNFDGGADDIPTYSLADLRGCAERDDKDYFRRTFGGKTVVIGTLLDVEDRRLTSKRLATGPEAARAPRCALSLSAATAPVRDSLAGVYLHATAINNLLRHEALTEMGRPEAAVVAVLGALLAAAAALLLTPVQAALTWLAAAILWTAVCTLVFRGALVLPLLQPLLASLATLALGVGYQFMVADKDKRLLRQSFALYLAPAVIDRMLVSSRPPELGGESRTVTIYFSDVAGFSTLTEKMTPHEVVAMMNVYLSAMTEIIEDEGGFVDKYIGDAIVAVFGAPVHDPAHAARAVRAALRCQKRLLELNRQVEPFRGRPLGQRIGLNSGEALVGNIGSSRRFNYTVMGDTVNLASRLEGANKFYGTSILAADATKTMAGSAFAWREVDSIRVKGREQPVVVSEPIAEGMPMPGQQEILDDYAQGLALWRASDFDTAARRFAVRAAVDRPSALFERRAAKLAMDGAPSGWTPINALDEK